jgi:hypothetical protein
MLGSYDALPTNSRRRILEPPIGIEPMTFRLQGERSTTELRRPAARVYRFTRAGNPPPVSVKDDLLGDFPHIYPGLTRPEIEQLLALLDKSSSTEGRLSLSIATALEPLVPDVAARIDSYKQSDDVDEYVRMLRGAAVMLLQEWQPENEPPAADRISSMIESIEADD